MEKRNDYKRYFKMTPKIYYRVLQTEGKLLNEMSNYYDGFVLEAHILEQFPKSLISFAITSEKPFFIDPTGKLSIPDSEKIVEKKWFKKILEAYKISEYFREEGIFIEALRKNLARFAKATINYQRKTIKQKSGGVALFGISGDLEPEIILSPYFLITDLTSDIYQLNLKLLKKSLKHKGENKLYATICIEKHLLFSRKIEKVISDFTIKGVDGYCVWIANFRETEEDYITLEKFVDFLKKLSNTGKPVINLFGGAFSVFLGKLGLLDKVVHGIGYGEYRDPYVSATGFAPMRYYLPGVFSFVPISVAQELISELPELECKCKFCKEAKITKKTDKNIKPELLKKHHIASRWKEKQKSFKDLFNDLQKVIRRLEQKNLFEPYWNNLRHLKNWEKVLR